MVVTIFVDAVNLIFVDAASVTEGFLHIAAEAIITTPTGEVRFRPEARSTAITTTPTIIFEPEGMSEAEGTASLVECKAITTGGPEALFVVVAAQEEQRHSLGSRGKMFLFVPLLMLR